MDCTECRQRLTGEWDGEVRSHLEACAACRQEAHLYRSTWDLLGAYPEIQPSDLFISRLKQRIGGVSLKWKILAPLMGAAAAVLLAFSLRSHPSMPPQITAEEKELVENLDLLENFELLQSMELVADEKGAPGAREILFDDHP